MLLHENVVLTTFASSIFHYTVWQAPHHQPNSLQGSHFELMTTSEIRRAKRRLFASQKREENASKWVHLYRPCTSVALSNCVTGSVKNLRQTKDTASGFNSANVLVKSKIQNENYQINRLKHLKNTE